MQLSSINETPQRRHWPPSTATNLFSNCALAAARGLATHLSQAVSLSLLLRWRIFGIFFVLMYVFIYLCSFVLPPFRPSG